ncbi:MAG TPA: energy transducer TonB [Blastocatellia bacterium]|jgi:TonB family protein|nr:energy transducer TonB [Blastocatellia bacterium]
MNSFIAVTTMIAWLLFSNSRQQNPYVERQLLFEKRAIADTQRALASDVDAELPGISFMNWFESVVGPRVGVTWQLSECGDSTEASLDSTDDIRACVEANTILADGRGVIVRIAVGTFKKGITGAPVFYFGVIEQEGNLFLVRRLSDLQKQLSAPGRLADKRVVELPEVNIRSVRLAANNTPAAPLEVWSDRYFDQAAISESGDPAPLPEPPRPKTASAGEITEGLRILGAVSWGGVISKAQPRYPPGAKRYNISGSVDVQVTISTTGRVRRAKAVGGHPLLRGAAEDAARQWVFRPATLKGVQVETQIVLTFVFKSPQ